MGEPAFRGESEVLVGPRIGVGLIWVGPGLGKAWYLRASLHGEPETLVRPQIRVDLVWVDPGLGGARYGRAHV